MCLLLCKEEGSTPVFAITERRDMGLYEVPMSMSLLGFGMGTMLTNFHMCGIMLVLRAVFNMLVRNASPRGPTCFRCLVSCYVISLYFLYFSVIVNGSVCLVCCMSDHVRELFGETIRNMLWYGCYFVVECYGSV